MLSLNHPLLKAQVNMELLSYSSMLILIGVSIPVIIILSKRVAYLRWQLSQQDKLYKKCFELISRDTGIDVDRFLEQAFADAFEGSV